jgi:hypothetical protein
MYTPVQVLVITLISAWLASSVTGFCSPARSLSSPYHLKFPSTHQTTCSPRIFVPSSTASSDSSFVPETTPEDTQSDDELAKIEKLGKVGP